MSTLKVKMEARAAAHATLTAELQKEQTSETRAKVATILAEIETMSTDIQNIQRADQMAKDLAITAPTPGAPGSDNRSAEEKAKEYRKAYGSWLRKGDANRCMKGSVRGGASEQDFAALNTAIGQFKGMSPAERAQKIAELRDQEAGTQSISYTAGAEGGYFVPAGFVYDIEKATKYFAPLLDGSCIRVLETATGQVLPYPTSNDTNQAWTILGEAQQVSDNGATPNYPGGSAPSANPGNVLASQITFNAWKGTTGLVRVSLELLQDSAFSIEAFLTEAFAVRLGRGYEWYLTNGTGSSQPKGLLPAIAASGASTVTAAGSSANDGTSATGANSIGYADLVNLVHSVDPTYRRSAKFMFHDQTLAHLKTRLDKFGKPLWVPSVDKDAPDTVAGYPYVINQAFPQIAASAVTVAFGAFDKFIARKVKDLSILRLDERFADFGEVAYVAFSRIDSQLVDAGTHPLNTLTQHS